MSRFFGGRSTFRAKCGTIYRVASALSHRGSFTLKAV